MEAIETFHMKGLGLIHLTRELVVTTVTNIIL
jgi:hypothetical protein